MRWRSGRIALLVFQAVWFNIIIPGHRRGIISLRGSYCAEASCCAGDECNKALATPTAPGAGHPDPPPRDNASHCAICQFSARLTLPPVIDYVPPLLGLALVLDPPAPVSADSVRCPLVLRDRAPPFVA